MITYLEVIWNQRLFKFIDGAKSDCWMNCHRFLSVIIIIFFIGSALWSRLENPLTLFDKCLKMRVCKHGLLVTYLHLLNYFWEMFHKRNRKSRDLCKFSNASRICVTSSNNLELILPTPRVYIRPCKHGERRHRILFECLSVFFFSFLLQSDFAYIKSDRGHRGHSWETFVFVFRETYGFFPEIRNAYEANIENADDSYTENAYKAVPKHNWAIHLREGKGRSKNLLGSMVMLSTNDVFEEK